MTSCTCTIYSNANRGSVRQRLYSTGNGDTNNAKKKTKLPRKIQYRPKSRNTKHETQKHKDVNTDNTKHEHQAEKGTPQEREAQVSEQGNRKENNISAWLPRKNRGTIRRRPSIIKLRKLSEHECPLKKE